ncbi:MAG: hypothetical protein ACI9S8_001161 [Chlamydiales bacterium]|jgi:hypothetical protein
MLEKFMSSDSEDTFFQEHWERSPMIIFGEDAGYFQDILTDSDIDYILSSFISLKLKIHVWEGESFVPSFRVDGQAYLGTKEAYKKYGEGRAVEIRNLKECWQPVRESCSILERGMRSINTEGSAVLIPSGGQAFSKIEKRSHTFFIPILGELFLRIFSCQDIEGGLEKAVYKEFSCKAGDFIYIPPGYRYEVNEALDPALLLLLSFEQYTWKSLIENVLGKVEENEGILNRRIPMKYLKGGAAREWKEEEEVFCSLTDSFLVRAVRDNLSLGQIVSSQSLDKRRLEVVNRVEEITLDSLLKMRKECSFFLYTDERDLQWLVTAGQTKCLVESEEREALDFVQRAGEYRVKDIPGFAATRQCLDFARFLLSLGVAEMGVE